MLLDSICNSKVYHQNAYYLLGLTVGMTWRKVKRRVEDLQGLGEMGASEWESAYDKFLMGSAVAPGKDLFADLAERIKDPEFAITESFFWFWPTGEGEDSALRAIADGNREVAFDIWRSLATKSTREAVVARHNLAILFHYYAVDAESRRLNGAAGADTGEYLKVLDGYWRTAFAYWEELVDDDDFWDAFADRVKEADDPRFGRDFVSEFRRQFPISFDNLNADFLVDYARVGRLDDAKRHFVYMSETMRGSDDVDQTLNAAFKPQIDKLRRLIDHCRESKVAEDGMKDIQRALDGSRDLFRVLRFLLPSESRMCRDLMNEVAKACHDRLPSYAKKTGDFEGALVVERQLSALASTASLKSAIARSLGELEKIVKERREADTCWYCKTYAKGMSKETVKMYGDLAPDMLQIGRVSYSTNVIHVPVCSECRHRFSTDSARDYPPIRKLLAAGWKIGTRPTDAEINAVWRGLADALMMLGRGRGF